MWSYIIIMSISNLFSSNDYLIYCDSISCSNINTNNINSNCINACANDGAGADVFNQIVQVGNIKTAHFRSLTQGANITLLQGPNDITISSTGGSAAEILLYAYPLLSTSITDSATGANGYMASVQFASNSFSFLTNKGGFTQSGLINVQQSNALIPPYPTAPGSAIIIPITGIYNISIQFSFQPVYGDNFRFNYNLTTCASDGSGESLIAIGYDWVNVPAQDGDVVQPIITRNLNCILPLNLNQNILFKSYIKQNGNPTGTVVLLGGLDGNGLPYSTISLTYLGPI